ncbi:MAG: molybdenum cofactor biosynthesis protein MoaE [Candidatus Eremiobacteraeota bacterium]|nr:molybdenum cofactor biosynthesis protein MoaE [Candidatus Eremiobacteraeota bacterium]MBC5827622.1 molybdenum cofactor biosynthesis protein MoaE [Candidatus Eremiobacteraeota bacterium]
MSGRFHVSEHPLQEARVSGMVSDGGAGGLVTFVGRVRPHSDGRQVERLEYEAYPEMAEAAFGEIASEAQRRFRILDVAIHHRVGSLKPGEIAVVVAVAAAHRGDAFEACRFVIDRLKELAPIWKKEHYGGGAVWIGAF